MYSYYTPGNIKQLLAEIYLAITMQKLARHSTKAWFTLQFCSDIQQVVM